jgi:hypothetical protein
MLPLHQRRILTYQMKILSPFRHAQPLSASLSFIGYHTVSPPKISYVPADGLEPPNSEEETDLQSVLQLPLCDTGK